MKQFNISFFSFAVWCFLSISAYSQIGQIKFENVPPSGFLTQDAVLRHWISVHYDVYHEDVSSEPWAQDFVSFWRHQQSIGAEPPYSWGISRSPRGYDGIQTPQITSSGIEFVGAWPVFILRDDSFVSPDWCTLDFFLDKLYYGTNSTPPNLAGTVMVPMLYWFSSGEHRIDNDSRYPLWSARLLVSNVVTKTTFGCTLPYTRLYFLAPYYPSWWALGGSYFPMSYDDGYDLLGHSSPFYGYDGYVFYTTSRVRLRQVVRWSSPE